MSTRKEHMDWCKARALAYLPDNPKEALASMLSDLGKHDETKDHPAIKLTVMLMLGGFLSTPEEIRKHIEGFN